MRATAIGYVGQRLLVVIAVFCAALAGLEAWHERKERAADVRNTETAALNVARAVAREADATFRLADTILFGITERLQNGDRSPEALGRLNKSMNLAIRNLDNLAGLFVYDAEGRWIASSLEQIPPGVNNADRAYFQSHQSDPSPAARLSEPIRSRSSGRWIMLVSRRLNNRDGSFAGVVAATVSVEHFVGRFSGFDVGPNGTIALLNGSGKILARQPYSDEQIGRDVSATPLFQDDLPRAPAGVGRYISPIDGNIRIAGFATARVFPVIAYAAISEDEALAPWRSGVITRVTALALLIAAIVILGWKLLRDVERRERAESELARSGERYRLLSEAATDMVTHMDLSGRRLYVSPASRDLLGYEPHELLGTSPQEAIHPDDAASLRAILSDLTIGAREHGVHVNRLRHRDGRWVWVEASLRRLQDATGLTNGFVASVRNIEARKADEIALLAAREQADTARAEAERANTAKTDFLAAMSHEIRTPLHAVIGFTELLTQADDLAPDLRRHAEFARTAGSALLTVVDDILDFSKVEAGAIALEARPFSPRALVESGLSIVRDLAERKGLAIATQIDPALPECLVGDENRLRQILLNFLNNAVKFTRRGSVTLIAAYEGAGPAGARVRFSVVDTGIGIPVEKQHRLFERFSQIDSSITRDFGGTGLGLAICKRLVGLMGGVVGVISDDDRGATFWFSVTLPRAAEAPVADRPDATRAPRRTGRILLVEDVEINQELARLILEAAGHDVAIVADGAAAVMAVEDGAFDLVLMDVQMPGMDGMTATRLIRRLKVPAARIPVIAMTANVLPQEIRVFREAGMDDHVGKPFDPHHLYEVIGRWLGPDPVPASPP